MEMIFGPGPRRLSLFYVASPDQSSEGYATTHMTPGFGYQVDRSNLSETAEALEGIMGMTYFDGLQPTPGSRLLDGMWTDPDVGDALAGKVEWECDAPRPLNNSPVARPVQFASPDESSTSE